MPTRIVKGVRVESPEKKPEQNSPEQSGDHLDTIASQSLGDRNKSNEDQTSEVHLDTIASQSLGDRNQSNEGQTPRKSSKVQSLKNRGKALVQKRHDEIAEQRAKEIDEPKPSKAEIRRLFINITFSLLGFYAFFAVVMGLIVYFTGIDISQYGIYLSVNVGFNVLLFLLLLYLREKFFYIRTKKYMEKINFPTVLTLSRMTSIPAIVMIIIWSKDFPMTAYLISFTVYAFISDFFDGKISRMKQQESRIGQYLDSSSDYALLMAITVAFHVFEFIPGWFIFLLLSRLLVQWFIMFIITMIQGFTAYPRSSFLGKGSVFTVMVFYGVATLQLVQNLPLWYDDVLYWLGLFTALIIAISFIEKIYFAIIDIRAGIIARKQGAHPDYEKDLDQQVGK
jgi:cardiolipin synthase